MGLAADLKIARKQGREKQYLSGMQIALIFEKSSTRTRCAFEVAAHDQGAHVTYLGPEGTQIGHKESMKDTARVLGRLYDSVVFGGAYDKMILALLERIGRAEHGDVVGFGAAGSEVQLRRRATDEFGDLLAGVFESYLGVAAEIVDRTGVAEPAGEIRYHGLGDPGIDRGGGVMIEVYRLHGRFVTPC